MRSTLILVTATLFAGCDGPSRDLSTLVRDSAGITIVVSPAISDETPNWTLSEGAVPLVGSEEVPLYQIVGAARTADGGIVVGNGGSRELFWFDPSGALSETSGGQGEGPGEYQWIGSLFGVAGDSVVVIESFSSRVDLYGPDRAIARSWPIGELGRFNTPAPFARLQDGTFVAVTQGTDDEYPGHQSYTAFVVRYRDGTPLDTLATFPGEEGYTVYCGPDNTAVCNMGVIYGRRLSTAGSGDRVVVSAGDEIRIFEGGVLARILRVDDDPVAVTPAAVAAFIDSVAAPQAPDRARVTRERFADAPHGRAYPRFIDLEIDAVGRIWAARGDTGSDRWDVFSPEGERVATVALPAVSKVWQIGEDWMLISQSDDLDIETVRILTFDGVR